MVTLSALPTTWGEEISSILRLMTLWLLVGQVPRTKTALGKCTKSWYWAGDHQLESLVNLNERDFNLIWIQSGSCYRRFSTTHCSLNRLDLHSALWRPPQSSFSQNVPYSNSLWSWLSLYLFHQKSECVSDTQSSKPLHNFLCKEGSASTKLKINCQKGLQLLFRTLSQHISSFCLFVFPPEMKLGTKNET